jgi:DNA repair exonuclease SbcCD ATPase subunit
MKQKIEKLTSEASSLKKSLAEAETKLSEFAKNTALSGEIEEKLMDFEARLASSEERAAEAEAKLEAAIAEANSTAKLRAEADKKLKTIETKLDEAEQRAAQAEANLAAAAKLAAETSALEAKIANLEAKLAAAEKKAGDAEAELAAVKVEVAPAPSTPEPAEELSVFSEIEEPVLSPTPATKKSPKKKPVNDPWASLSESAIKRKTVKELSDYLSDKVSTSNSTL